MGRAEPEPPDASLPRFLLADGQECTIQPMLWDNYRITIGPPGLEWFERAWDYVSFTAVVFALADWVERYDDVIEPTGWFRAIDGTGRRRRDSDPAQEYVEW